MYNQYLLYLLKICNSVVVAESKNYFLNKEYSRLNYVIPMNKDKPSHAFLVHNLRINIDWIKFNKVLWKLILVNFYLIFANNI